jgi:hypothetical protein
MAMFKVTPMVKPRTQPLSTCCWLTCLEMLFEWKKDKGDSGKNPGTILQQMDKSTELYPYAMRDSGIAMRECKPTAKILGLRWAGDTKVIDAQVLTDSLKAHGPLWIAGEWETGSPHVIVVTACNPETGSIKYVNPWKNGDLSESNNTVSWLQERGNTWSGCDASIMYWE